MDRLGIDMTIRAPITSQVVRPVVLLRLLPREERRLGRQEPGLAGLAPLPLRIGKITEISIPNSTG